MIELEKVQKTYVTDRIETLALAGVDVRVERGEFVAVMGPSGSGKSTLLHVMGLLDPPSAGQVRIGGRETSGLSDRELARLRNQAIGFVFQTFHLVPDLPVVDNVEIPLLYRRMGWRERRERALEALERVGLGSRTRHLPSQLSGGQQQRVAIARAVVGRPQLLLADEPTGNLDSSTGEQIMETLVALNRRGKTIIMVTHEQDVAAYASSRLHMRDGLIDSMEHGNHDRA